MEQARGAGESAGAHDERVFFQILTNTTDGDLLQSIPTGPDGAALFAATAGGSARFGVTGGNLLSGGGVASAAAVRSDYWTARSRYAQWQDTEGQPLWPASIIDQAAVVVYGAVNEEVFSQAFGREVIQGTSAGVSDEIRAMGKQPVLWSTQRITDNDWFTVLDGTPVRPVFAQNREPFDLYESDRTNSDLARETDQNTIYASFRRGYGVNLPYAAIHVDN